MGEIDYAVLRDNLSIPDVELPNNAALYHLFGYERDQLLAAIDRAERAERLAAFVKQRLYERHGMNALVGDRHCGARAGESVDTCPYCEPYRKALAEWRA